MAAAGGTCLLHHTHTHIFATRPPLVWVYPRHTYIHTDTQTHLHAHTISPRCRASMAADFSTHLAPLLSRYPGRLGHLAAGWSLEAFM